MTPTEVKAIRLANGLTQSDLAKLLMTNIRTVGRWERGEVPISGPTLIVLEMMAAGELPNRYY